MRFKSEELWADGEPVKSESERILEFLEQHSDEFCTETFIASEVLDEAEIPEYDTDLPPDMRKLQETQSFIGSAKAQALLEELVRDGEVEKREIRIQDMLEKITAEADQDLLDNLPYDVSEKGVPDYDGNTRPFYRIAK